MMGQEQKPGKTAVEQQYLAEGLVALLPDYGSGDGTVGGSGSRGGTRVLTLQGVYQEPRSLPWLVEVLARYYRLDLAALRRHTGRLLELRHHIPLPLAEGLVLLPVKVRRAGELGEHTTGYVTLAAVEQVEPVAEDHVRCRIICQGRVVVPCFNTAATVRAKLLQGEKARQDLQQRQRLVAGPVVSFSGLQHQALRELLPTCDCLLRSFLLLLLEKISPAGVEPEAEQKDYPTHGKKR